jgi:hypothetical protein
MADVEFVIPTNKDELLQGEPGQYSVTNVCSLPELSEKLSGIYNVCHTAFLSIQNVTFVLKYSSNRFLSCKAEAKSYNNVSQSSQVCCHSSYTLKYLQIILV